MNKNSFAAQVFLAFGLCINFIKVNISNVSLGLSVLFTLRYLFVSFGFDTMTLGVAVCLLIVSLTTSLPQKKEKEEKNNNRRY